MTDPELSRLRAEIDGVEREALRRIDPGGTALVVAVAALVLLASSVLPWVGGAAGLRVLTGQAASGVLPRLFGYLALLFGVLGSALGLVLRRWGMAWVCGLGCFLGTVIGVLSIWTQQTTASHHPGPGPGFGLVLAVLAVLVLAVQWLRIAASRR